MCDPSPTKLHEGSSPEKLMSLRPRQVEKEIGPPSFRYQANGYLQKVSDSLQNKNPTLVIKTNEFFANTIRAKTGLLKRGLESQNMPMRDRKIFKDTKIKVPEKFERMRTKTSPAFAVRPKLVLPNLHDKTHFKAAMEYTMVD